MTAMHLLEGVCVLNPMFLQEHCRELKNPLDILLDFYGPPHVESCRVLLHQASLRVVGPQYGTCGRGLRIFWWSCVQVVMLGLLRAFVLFILALVSVPYVAATAARHRTTSDTNLAVIHGTPDAQLYKRRQKWVLFSTQHLPRYSQYS